MIDIEKNLKDVKNRIETAALRVGRDPSSVTLVAVSKVHPPEAIREAYKAGQRHFGENYAQEMRDKSKELSDLKEVKWHFIGHLQRNKAKLVVPSVSILETVDSVKTIEELIRQSSRFERTIGCLVQVNVGEEEQKSGCQVGETENLLFAMENAPGLELKGLMTIPPWDLEPEETRVHFKALFKLRENLGGEQRLPHLSMGMSHDFEVAVEEGATFVRVGTAIFGTRR
jgi:pyridoxal phosphate enzyme (YggS family)